MHNLSYKIIKQNIIFNIDSFIPKLKNPYPLLMDELNGFK